MKLIDKTYTFLCALPVAQTVIGGSSAVINFLRMINDIGQMALHPEGRIVKFIQLSKHLHDFRIAVISAIPVVGTIYNVSVLFKASKKQEETKEPASPSIISLEKLKRIKETEPNAFISLEVKKTLDLLFEGSPYSINTLPVYPHIITEEMGSPKRKDMDSPIMIGKSYEDLPFIAIKLERCLSNEDFNSLNEENQKKYLETPKKKDTLILYQRDRNSYDKKDYEPLVWFQLGSSSNSAIFFTNNFTYEDGKGPTTTQEDGFWSLQKLLKLEEVRDLKGNNWKISEK